MPRMERTIAAFWGLGELTCTWDAAGFQTQFVALKRGLNNHTAMTTAN